MADQFSQAGYPSVSLDGDTPGPQRRAAIARLRRGEIRAIFTVDIFNEGVDIPEVDTILLLRPTESATVFLQQLGRGLRWSPESGKTVLTVLDFIGQAHAEYRFDVRYRALIGGTRAQIARSIEHGFPLMPPGCVIRLDEIAQEIVLENLKSAIKNRRRAMAEDLRQLPAGTTLSGFLDETTFELTDVYARPSSGMTFNGVRRAAGHLRDKPGPVERAYSNAVGRLLHVSDDERYATWRGWLSAGTPPTIDSTGSREWRLALMLFAGLGLRNRPVSELGITFAELWADGSVRRELVELLDALRDGGFPATAPIDPFGPVPIHSHATYSRYEVLAAYGDLSKDRLRPRFNEGVLWNEQHKTDLFFVTLNKSGTDFSPTTSYNDYPISPTLFHWESQSTTGDTSKMGLRYINHLQQKSRVIIFVRQDGKDERDESNPFVCLGPARYVSHESSRPIKITWELERPMPPEFLDFASVAAG
jgi:hypothetical protein